MRSMTAAQAEVVQAEYRQLNYDVRVLTKGGQHVSLRHYRGREFLKRLSITADIDSPSIELELEAQREWESISLAPLMSRSIGNRQRVSGAADVLFELDNRVQVFAGIPGRDVLTEDFMCIFVGRIVSVDAGSPTIKVVCRDAMHDMNAAWILDAEQELGTTAGTPVETIIADLMTRYGAGIPSIHVPVSPNWLIKPYKQQRMSLYEAVSRFAEQIGWDLRWKWYPGDIYDGAPTLYLPDRQSTTVQFTFNPDAYFDLTAMPSSLDDVRNSVYVSFGPPGARQTSWHMNTISRDKYRLVRAMWIEEASDSPLQSMAEASLMSDNILSDLAFPKAVMTASMPLFPWTELNDLYAFAPNGVHFDTTLNFTVSGYTHEISEGEATTSLTLRDGAAAAGHKSWLRREYRQGVKYL